MDDGTMSFTCKAEQALLRMLKAWGEIESGLPPRRRRGIEIALLLATVHALEGREDDHGQAVEPSL